jgi:hypothetical protein
MSIDFDAITSDELYRFIHEPFSLPESRKFEILDAIENDVKIHVTYEKLLKRAGYKNE